MALILAVNPGNSHSPTLSRLARELKGCELIGADSCGVAIKAISERTPDIVLLPAKTARGEDDLIARLNKIPGGTLTLRLPPVQSADPLDIARQIREMLTGPPPAPEPQATSPHLIAAAHAAINWIHARRAQWAEPLVVAEPVAETVAPPQPRPAVQSYQPPDLYEPIELPDDASISEEEQEVARLLDANTGSGLKDKLASYWPVAAGIVVVAVIAVAAISC